MKNLNQIIICEMIKKFNLLSIEEKKEYKNEIISFSEKMNENDFLKMVL
jgi:hypothetical protein